MKIVIIIMMILSVSCDHNHLTYSPSGPDTNDLTIYKDQFSDSPEETRVFACPISASTLTVRKETNNIFQNYPLEKCELLNITCSIINNGTAKLCTNLNERCLEITRLENVFLSSSSETLWIFADSKSANSTSKGSNYVLAEDVEDTCSTYCENKSDLDMKSEPNNKTEIAVNKTHGNEITNNEQQSNKGFYIILGILVILAAAASIIYLWWFLKKKGCSGKTYTAVPPFTVI